MAKTCRLDQTQVVAAAAEIADANGLEALTLAALAKRLDIRIPSLYNHIDGLDALRREIGLLGLRDLDAQLTRAAAGRQGADALRAVAHAYFQYGCAHPGRYLAAQRPARVPDPELDQAGAAVVDLIRVILEPFGLSARRRVHAIRGFRALIHGFLNLRTAGGFGLPVAVENSLDHALLWFFSGLEQPTRRPRRRTKQNTGLRRRRP